LKISDKIILTGRDLIKGEVTKKNLNQNSFLEATPWQMVELEDKTQKWKEWNADYFEWIGLNQVRLKKRKIIKNRRLAAGILDIEDYLISDVGDIAQLQNWSLPEDTENSLHKFHPLIPPFLKVLDGEFLKRNLKVHVSCTDRNTEDEKLEYKKNMVDKTLTKLIISQREKALQEAGLSEVDENGQQNKEYFSELEAARELAETQSKYKSYRHIFEQFGQHVINKDYDKFKMAELEREAFMETLCNSGEYWHIDLGEDGYKPKFLDSADVFKHTSKNIKYVADGDYVGWFEEMTTGDIINEFGRDLTKEQFDLLKQTLESYNNTLQNGGGTSLVAHELGFPGAYYDTSKPYPEGRMNRPMADYWRGENLEAIANNFQNLPSSSVAGIFNNGSTSFSSPKMFRVMRLYWKSQNKIGWLTKKDRSGQVVFQNWIDENFKVTVNPIYDNTVTNEKSKVNLVYGEHIDWEWVNEWRKIVKINNNIENAFWKNQNTYGFEPMYIGGDRVKFQFSGNIDNPYEVYPPVEGVEFKMKQVKPVSAVDLLSASQIDFNIARNKIPEIMFHDIGLVASYAKSMMKHNSPGSEGVSPREDMLRTMREDKIFEYEPPDKDMMMQYGNVPIKPEVLDLSRIKEGLLYLEVADGIKRQAGQIIGISDSRLAQSKASQTATGVENDVNFSETQTEPYFHQHIVEFMPRVYTRMLEAAQYYCTINESARVAYQTTNQENIFLEVENMEGLPRNYNIRCTSDIREATIKAKLEKLFLENNTTDASLLELAQGITKDSPSEILEELRKAQINREKKQQQEYEREMQEAQAERDAAQKRQDELLSYQKERDQLDRESQERIAETRALGGIQTDADADGMLDAAENIRRDRQLQDNQNNFDKKLSLEEQKHNDSQRLAREQMLNKTAIEQKKLAAAIVNMNRQTDKALSKKVAKSQGVTK
jgi:hypothetical protein